MKFDLKHLQKLAEQVPDIISKGQQVIKTTQSALNYLQGSKEEKVVDPIKSPDVIYMTDKEIGSDNRKSEVESTIVNDQVVTGVVTLANPLSVADTIKEMVDQANETIRYCEEQETMRTEIRANAAVEISKINAMADMVRDYLKRSFDERAGLFDNYFTVLDKALEKGDNVIVAQTLQSINSLAASSPFKDLTDINKVSTMLSEGREWDI